MLEVRQSNRLDVLAQQLVERLRVPGGGGVLQSDVVVVQSPGMATWLRHRIAETLGIAAAVEFPLPASFLWRVVRAVIPDVPADSPFDKRGLRWHLFRLLAPESALLADPRCARLARYLADDQGGLKRFQLAERIADVLDQYLVYRPDWLRRWRAGEDTPALTEGEPWQPVLWRALVASVGDRQGTAAAEQDRASLTARARARLEREDCRALLRAAGLPGRVAVFGISAMPPEQLRLLLALSDQLDVTLYAFNPCRQYWTDIVSEAYLTQLEAAERVRDEGAPTHPYYEVGHPLLAELGASGRDFLDLVLELGEGAELVDAFVEPEGDHALATLQRDILDLDGGSGDRAEQRTLAPDDDSVQLLDCHGPLRELEVLHDRLLERFAADPALEPREIVVMIPDIDRYAPYVEAVFGGEAGEAAIPYAISDRGLGGETPVLATLAALLRLPRSRLTASEVLGLLEAPAVLRACGLRAEDVEQLGHWVSEAGVRWGLDDAHWSALGFPHGEGESEGAERANTWAFGADRLLLGYAMGEAEAPFAGRLPLAGVEGDGAEAIGRLLDFVARLAAHADALRGPHAPAVWAERIRALLEDCFDEESGDTDALNGVRQALLDLELRSAAAAVQEPLSLDVLLAVLEPALTAREGGHRFLGGRVTFCTLMPMRTIPFRIVALLGMNDEDYPRRDVPLDFDLLSRRPRKGDRARRLEDRFLFLEALLAAREHLIVSWAGHDPVDDSERPPSVVVSALLDALDRRFLTAGGGPAREQLLRAHPLQPFSARYDGETLHTASTLWTLDAAGAGSAPAAAAPGRVRLPEPESPADEALSLQHLAAFLVDPPGAILRERFGVRLEEVPDEVEDDEPFDLVGLARYRVRDGALNVLLAGGDVGAWLRREAATGRLPQGHSGADALAQARALLEDYEARLGPLLALPRSAVAVEVLLGETRIVGEVDDCTAPARVLLRPGTASERDRMRAWVAHLALAAAGEGRATLLVDDKLVHCFRPLEAAVAREHLADLVAVRAALLVEPAPLLCASSAAWARAVAEGRDAEALDAARAEWTPSDQVPGRREGERADVLRLWPRFPGDDEALRPDFEALAARVWAPLVAGGERLTATRVAAVVDELCGVVHG
ncbi:MAG: exodeoxyribonuclease V subunit gamma [Pseudomonadales bacterium]|jgi:exodeoxyribonuclease V gamma subunit|nr:exodeoxyribonuclease V subunit gamma [Pseudomonadales bacterium]